MSGITSHVLDTSLGKPAAGIKIELEFKTENDDWLASGVDITDSDGRVPNLIADDFKSGHYRIRFAVAEYFEAQQVDSFYPSVQIEFLVADASQHYHVPLLLNPFGYSTYRGS